MDNNFIDITFTRSQRFWGTYDNASDDVIKGLKLIRETDGIWENEEERRLIAAAYTWLSETCDTFFCDIDTQFDIEEITINDEEY